MAAWLASSPTVWGAFVSRVGRPGARPWKKPLFKPWNSLGFPRISKVSIFIPGFVVRFSKDFGRILASA